MYQYNDVDQRLVDERVTQFRDQVARRMSGELADDAFKPLRLMNGLYLQLHAYMLRVAIPYGTLSPTQLRMLAHVARKYDRGYGHFTTRQNIQYNWIKLEEAPDILADLATVQLHAIQTSGNCVRNVTSDQYAGAVAEELEDPRIWAEIIRQWSTFHPEFSFLPRKFKIAVTGSPRDRAAIKLHDIGVQMVRNELGEVGFAIVVGGGMGRTPFVGPTIRAFLPKEHLLSYLEAILRVYNLHGRRDNIYKARVKVLVDALGPEEFARQVEEEWAHSRDGALTLAPEQVAAIAAHFAPPPFEELPDASARLNRALHEHPDFAAWVRHNTVPHRQPGYVIANISLKPPGSIPGDATAAQLDLVANLAERYSFAEARVTHAQNLVLPHVQKNELFELWRALGPAALATPNLGLITDIIACPGLDYCALANARSIPVAQRLSERFADLGYQEEIGPLEIKISGCINACGHHHVGHIGILGIEKSGEEFYQIMLGGNATEDASLGQILGPAFAAHEIVDAVERVVRIYLSLRQDNERFSGTVRRVGLAPFKEQLYAAA